MNDRDVQTERPVSTVREEVNGDLALLPDARLNDFRSQWETLESGWTRGAEDTEELRQSFQRYRSFFNRLLET